MTNKEAAEFVKIFPLPWTYSDDGCILDAESHKVIGMRGLFKLLPEIHIGGAIRSVEQAMEIQDNFGQWLVTKLNKELGS